MGAASGPAGAGHCGKGPGGGTPPGLKCEDYSQICLDLMREALPLRARR